MWLTVDFVVQSENITNTGIEFRLVGRLSLGNLLPVRNTNIRPMLLSKQGTGDKSSWTEKLTVAPFQSWESKSQVTTSIVSIGMRDAPEIQLCDTYEIDHRSPRWSARLHCILRTVGEQMPELHQWSSWLRRWSFDESSTRRLKQAVREGHTWRTRIESGRSLTSGDASEPRYEMQPDGPDQRHTWRGRRWWHHKCNCLNTEVSRYSLVIIQEILAVFPVEEESAGWKKLLSVSGLSSIGVEG